MNTRDNPVTAEALRWLLFLINILTALAGLGLVILGFYGLGSRNTVMTSPTAPVMMIILGCLVFVISFVGCYGAFTANKRAVAVFAWVLLILVGIQLLMVIMTSAMQSKADSYLDTMWQSAYDEHPRIIRDIQDEFACCGFKHTEDRAIPKSSADACVRSPYFGYTTSCYRSLKRAYKSQEHVILGVGLALMGVQILSLLCAFALHRHLNDLYYGREPEREGLLGQYRERAGANLGGATVGERN